MNLTYDGLVKLIDNVVDIGDIELYYSLEEILRASIFYHNKIKEYEDNVELISMTCVGYLAMTKYIEIFEAWHQVDGWYWKISQLNDQIGDLGTIYNNDTAEDDDMCKNIEKFPVLGQNQFSLTLPELKENLNKFETLLPLSQFNHIGLTIAWFIFFGVSRFNDDDYVNLYTGELGIAMSRFDQLYQTYVESNPPPEVNESDNKKYTHLFMWIYHLLYEVENDNVELKRNLEQAVIDGYNNALEYYEENHTSNDGFVPID